MIRRRVSSNARYRAPGQSAMEYGFFVAVVAAALLAMGTYIRRSIQANLKVMEGQVNAEAIR